MLRKRAIAAALTVIGVSLIWTVGAQAAPTELTVRIEGKEKTLFEGPILTEGHGIRASSDTVTRRCDGTNNAAHPAAVPTPTAASVDAMELVGQTFDGDWFAGFDDYFIERWGPDAEGGGAFWGIFVNGVLIPVGGCQFADHAGDEALWVYDAFAGRSLLRLAAADDPSTAPDSPLPTAHVEVGQPLDLKVQSYIGGEGESPEVEAAEGATVAPVATEAGTDFETVETSSPEAVTTGSGGSASVTFNSAGWQRLKAQDDLDRVRSNRLDVCVEPVGGGSCGPPPGDAQLRVPARYENAPRPDEGATGVGSNPGMPPAKPAPSNAFLLRRGRLDARTGTATIEVVVPGPGHVALSGGKVHAVSIEARGAGIVKLKVSPTAAAAAALRRRGMLRVAVRVSFTPAGGATSAREQDVVLRSGSAAG